MSVSTGGLTKGLTSAQTSLKNFQASVGVSGKALAGLAIKAAAVLGPILAFNKVVGEVFDQMNKLDRIGKFSDEVGLTVDELRGLSLGAGLSGTSVETLEKGLQRMTRRIGEARMGMGEGVKGLDMLGLAAADLTDTSSFDALGNIADAIKELPDPASKAAAAYSLFGRQGQEMLSFLNAGSEGMEAFKKQLIDTQGSISRTDVSKIEFANDAIALMGEAFKSIYQQLAINLAPFMTVVANKITEFGSMGKDSGDSIAKGMQFASDAIGITADVVDALLITFKFLRAGVTSAIFSVVRQFGLLGLAIQEVVNLLPGVEVSFGDTLQAIAGDMEKLAGEQFADAMKHFGEPPPSTKINKFFNDVKTESEAAAQAMQKNSAANALTDSIIEANEAGLDYIQTLQNQIDTMKIGEEQMKLNEFANQGASEGILSQVKALQEQKKALEELQDLQAQADSLTDKFVSPIEKFKSEFEKLKTLLDKGLISETTFKSASLDALPDKVKGIIDQMKSPMEKFQSELKELEEFKAAGLINSDQFQFAVDQLKKDLGGAGEVKLASAAEFGSQEARSAILKNRLGGKDPMTELQKTEKEALAENKKQTTELKKIASNKINIVTF